MLHDRRRLTCGALLLAAAILASGCPAGESAFQRGEPNFTARLFFFLPNRILDLLDIVSFRVGLGFGYPTIDVHVTRFFTFGGDCSRGEGVGNASVNPLAWRYKRNLCAEVYATESMGFGPMYDYRFTRLGFGSGWDNGAPGSGTKEYSCDERDSWITRLDEPVYVDGERDPWEVGAALGMFPFAAFGIRGELGIHPVELVDFVFGFVTGGGVDVVGDDLGRLAPQ